MFDRRKSTTKIAFKVPCGRCIGCRMERARQWGLRCMHEAKLWPHNSYVTLTYSDEFLPPGGTLSLRDVQLFMKRLRKFREPNKVRFFLAGEYGDTNLRPHYHALLFNVGFENKVCIGRNARGEPLWSSPELSALWSVDGAPMGHCSIGEVTFDSAVYCAKYALKKINGDAALEHYRVYDSDGIIHDRRPEFAVMSRRPGVGFGYYERFGDEVRTHDSIIVEGREVRPPRFYDVLSERIDPKRLELLKRKRKRMSLLNRHDNTPERLAVKERLMQIALEKKERKL